MTTAGGDRFEASIERWLDALEARHLRDLTFQEVSRALRALSSCYVERRGRLAEGAALEGSGKRAAFSLFYAPLHLLVTAHIVRALGLRLPERATILDFGCGTGAGSAGWALASGQRPAVMGIDRSGWAVSEAEWNWRTLGVDGRAVRGDLARLQFPPGTYACLAAFVANELNADTRSVLRTRLLSAAHEGYPVLIVEPLAKGAVPWWPEWVDAFGEAGGEARIWREAMRLPDLVARLDRAAGLNHRELTARTIHVSGVAPPAGDANGSRSSPRATARARPESAPRRRRPS